jgi:hypothetical protein
VAGAECGGKDYVADGGAEVSKTLAEVVQGEYLRYGATNL